MAHPVYGELLSFGGSQHSQGQQFLPFKTSKQSLKVLLLHGEVDILIDEAKNLPNLDMFHKKLDDFMSMLPGKVKGKIEGEITKKNTSDPYVTVAISGAVIGRTFVIRNTENPVWRQHFNVPVAHYAAELHFVVKDDDVVGSQIIGAVGIPVERLCTGERIQGTFPILGSDGKPCKQGAELSISIQYTPVEKLSCGFQGVPGTYFPLRKAGKVTLYQDAHCPDDSFPKLRIDGGIPYKHGNCWRDVFDAISQARRLVYITGWSVVHDISLVRDNVDAKDYVLGDLLKAKSQEGVRVLLLVWDDPTSRSFMGHKREGIMQTNDEDTRRYFKNSSVQVLLCQRSAGKGHSWTKNREAGIIYTHHQKTVIVDTDAGNHRRKVTAFIGGLDLCTGRYDNPNHPILTTLKTLHKDDYYNGCFVGPTEGCPRQPWHDLHSRIDGPAAYDILQNFEERSARASKPHGLHKIKSSFNDQLLHLERIHDMVGISDVSQPSGDDKEAWHVQVFRSIDSNSVKGFPDDPKDATSRNLLCGKNVLIDPSIHTAYVKAIREAKHFIYVENQYFLGSSYNWDAYKDLGANNLIPMEIALKIAKKIKAKERFSAYIVIPMWPEGVPTSNAIQRILFWQHKTMEMMYDTIYKALQEVGLDNQYEPQDYLNFFCLGKREGSNGEDVDNSRKSKGSKNPQELARKNRRFMIYVHSKGMIVDDEYIILGSANINQRSMEGTRDTEIAMGAYQPHYTWSRKQCLPQGQIHGYRMSLWAEHIGTLEESFEQPDSLECIRRVRMLSESNWRQYVADEVTEMKGHLLKYPVEVDRMGKVKPLPGCETFPDVGGRIEGSFMGIQENLTI